MDPRKLPIPHLKPGDKVVVVHPYTWLKADKIYTVEEVGRHDLAHDKEKCFTFVKIKEADFRHYIYRFALANDVPSLEEML